MCRWIFYYGEEVCLGKLLYGATHGLANMSEGAGYTPGCERNHRRNHPVNVHGCGVGWYACDRCGLVDGNGLDAYCRPSVYTTVAAPSHDRNLRSLSKNISSSLLFGHVRAAGPGASVHQYNCHPFYYGRYMFMHNGDITDFKKIRRGLLALLRDDLFEHMSGTTDSELLFHLILNEFPDHHTLLDPARIQEAVLSAMAHVIRANNGAPSSINIAITDGETVIATRYRNSDHEEPPSLYFHLGPMPGERTWDLDALGGFDAMESNPRLADNVAEPHVPGGKVIGGKDKFIATQALLVSSEPLSGRQGLDRWELLPANCMITAAPTRPTVGRCTRAALVAKLREQAAGGANRHNLAPASAPVLEVEIRCMRDLCRQALGDKCAQGSGPVADVPTPVAPTNAVGRSSSARGYSLDGGGGLPISPIPPHVKLSHGYPPHRSNSVESNMTHADAIAMEERGAVHHERTSSGGALDSSVTHSGNPIVGFQPVAPVGSSRPAGALGTTAESQAVSGLAGLRVTDGGGSSGGALETIDQSPQTAGSGDGFDEAWRAEARREAEMFIGSDSSSSEPIAINGGGGGMSRTKSIGSRLASTSLVERTGDWRSYNPVVGAQ